MPLDLLVPDLLLPADAPAEMRALRLPALERWLARAERSRRAEADATALLASAFALAEPPPVAAIALAADDAPREGQWMRADPVHLRIEQDSLALQDPSTLAVERGEATALVAALQEHFRGDGLEFAAPAADRWYVRVPEGEVPRTVPLDTALGRNVFGLLPRGGGAFNWSSALTEAQMLLAGHEVNERREAAGRPAINSVWFWGEGAAPREVASPYALVYAADAFTLGLAALSRTRAAQLPERIGDVDAVRESDSVLVHVDTLARALRRGDGAAWTAAAQKLDHDWFVDAGPAIDRFGSVRVILPTRRDALVAVLDASARWRWLRRKRPLASHA